MGISDEMLESMKAQAKSGGGGGTYVILDEPGEFAAGTVIGIEKEQTSFGEVEELVLADVRTKYGNLDGERRLRLSRSVLQRELGSEAENGPAKPGQIVYVEYHGEATSKQGRQFHRYSVMKMDADAAAKPSVSDVKKVTETLANEFGGEAVKDEEIPF